MPGWKILCVCVGGCRTNGVKGEVDGKMFTCRRCMMRPIRTVCVCARERDTCLEVDFIRLINLQAPV